MAIPLNASFQNNRNNGYATPKQASTLFEVGQFLVYNGLGQVIPYDGNDIITYNTLVGGPFTVGETITGGTSTATAVVVSDSGTSLIINTVSGTFISGETITGGTSLATAVIIKFTVRNKILGLSNEQVTAATTGFATTKDISVSTPVAVLDFLDIPVTVGTATAAMVGQYFDVDTAEPGALDVSAAGSQILVTRVIDADNVVGVIALSVA